MLYHEKTQIEKMAFIVRSRNCLTMYSYNEAGVVKFCF